MGLAALFMFSMESRSEPSSSSHSRLTPLTVEDPTTSSTPRLLGEVIVLLFGEDGLPLASFDVVNAPERVTSDGILRLVIAPGIHHFTLRFTDQGCEQSAALPEVGVVAGEQTEILARVGADGVVTAEVFLPPGVGLPTRSEDGLDDQTIARATSPADTCAPAVWRGIVLDEENGAPVKDVQVMVRGATDRAVTDAAGKFTLTLAAGAYDASLIHPGYITQMVEQVNLTCGAEETQTFWLMPRKNTLDPLVVRVPHIAGTLAAAASERRESTSISEVLGSEQMSKSGDSDAAAALRRVTGLTVVGGKYVYVRGLGERYSATLMNGSSLPSPEPERRVVPLDLFPAGVLDGLLIHKTYSPELPGEFGGGTVLLRTRGIPDAFTLKLQLGVSGIAGTTFADGLRYEGGPLDVLGLDGGFRSLPSEVRAASRDQALLPGDRFSDRGYSAEELEAFGESLANRWQLFPSMMLPGFSLSGEVGDRFSLGDWQLGYLGAINFGNGAQTLRYQERYLLVGQNGEMETSHQYQFYKTTVSADLGAMLTLGAALADAHELRATTFLGRITDDEAREYVGENRDVSTEIWVSRLRFIERTLLSEQLTGTHRFADLNDLRWNWSYTYALARRDEPDRRETRFDREPGTNRWLLSDRPEGNQRFFSELLDHSHDVQTSLRLPFSQWSGLESHVEVGLASAQKSRVVDTRRFKFQHKGPLSGDPKIITMTGGQIQPEEIFRPENIGPDGFQFEEFTQPTDNYDANQWIAAGYAMTELPLGLGFRLQGGVRLESGYQYVRTFQLFNPDQTPVLAELQTLDVLPAANLSYDVSEDIRLRAAFSKTISRPDFRELSPATFNDVTGGQQIFGNPDLERAQIYAGDLRFEWYPDAGTQVSVAGFYKHFIDPIEQVVIPSAQQSITYQNAQAADNLGVEVEGRAEVGNFLPLLEGAYVAGNASLIFSRVSLLEQSQTISTSKERALQGQSPYVVNLQLGYDHEDLGLSTALLYNVYGARIQGVGALGAPDIFESPFHALDLILSKRLPGGLSLKLKAKNLIDLPQEWTQGGTVLSSVQRGRALSLSVSWAL